MKSEWMRGGLLLVVVLAVVLLAVVLAVGSGCSNKLLRETVLANTETMVGVAVAQNSQTQGYEFKLGYARHELFMVPTDKFVQYAESGGMKARERDSKPGADVTANVVGEIRVGVRSQSGGQGARVYQRLAVGDIAVRSGAAVALMADDTETAAMILRAQAAGANTAKAMDEVRQGLLDQIEGMRGRYDANPPAVTGIGAVQAFQSGREFGNFIAERVTTQTRGAGAAITTLTQFRASALSAELAKFIEEWNELAG